VNVPDDRYNWLVDLYKPKSGVPAFLEIVDIAGLVRWAAREFDRPARGFDRAGYGRV
jgi:hypothetical protein